MCYGNGSEQLNQGRAVQIVRTFEVSLRQKGHSEGQFHQGQIDFAEQDETPIWGMTTLTTPSSAKASTDAPFKKPNAQQFVPYRRVSTREQGASGLGLAAQLGNCELYLVSQPGAEVLGISLRSPPLPGASGPNSAALALCRQTRAKLQVAKLDRLSRIVSEIALRMADKSKELSEQERPFNSQRTKAPPAIAKTKV